MTRPPTQHLASDPTTSARLIPLAPHLAIAASLHAARPTPSSARQRRHDYL